MKRLACTWAAKTPAKKDDFEKTFKSLFDDNWKLREDIVSKFEQQIRSNPEKLSPDVNITDRTTYSPKSD